jgi:hypothetical protein
MAGKIEEENLLSGCLQAAIFGGSHIALTANFGY